MPAVVFCFVEVAGSAERNSARMTKEFPLSQRCLYSKRRTWADDGFDRSKITVDEIKSCCDKLGDFGHQFPLSQNSEKPDTEPRLIEVTYLVQNLGWRPIA